MDKQNICAIQQNQWKDKIINEKLKRNDKNIKSDLKQTDKKKLSKKMVYTKNEKIKQIS